MLSLLTSVEVNTISMAWLIPQYFVVTVGEVLFSITGLAFAYSQVGQAGVVLKNIVYAMQNYYFKEDGSSTISPYCSLTS